MAVRVHPSGTWRSRRATLLTAIGCAALAGMLGLATARLGSFQHQLKAVILIGGSLAMIAAALRPDRGLALLVVLTPFQLGFLGSSSDRVLLPAIALVVAWRIKTKVIPPWLMFGTATLVLGSFVASIGAVDRGTALEGAVNWLAASVVLVVALNVFRGQRDAARRMVDLFTGSAIVVVFFGFLQYAGIYIVVGAPFSGLPSSFFGYYTNYAGYVALAATLATGEALIALVERDRRRLAAYGFALVTMLAGLSIATSRGGIVALAAGWLVLLVLNVRRGSILGRAVAMLIILAGAAYIATPASTVNTIVHRLSASDKRNGDDLERFALQAAGKRALVSHPFGLGYGNFSHYLNANARSATLRQTFFHAQNTPIQIGLDAGWIGLAGFMTLLLWPILSVLGSASAAASTVRASAFAAALGGMLAQGLYDYLFDEVAFLVFFVALVWGVTHSLSLDREASERRRLGLRRSVLPSSVAHEHFGA
jgi:O-antigen ligase